MGNFLTGERVHPSLRKYFMTKFTFCSTITLIFLMSIQANRAFSTESELVGAWNISVPPRGLSGEPCPFVPDSIQFFADKTMTM